MTRYDTATFPRVAPSSSAARVLLVEDDQLLARSIERAILTLGYEVTVTTDGMLASQALTESAFDVVLSDISMPQISGLNLLRVVRAYDLDVPVVLMTGRPSVDTAAEAVALGAFNYLVKPVPLDTLQRVLERATTLGRLARAKREAMLSHGSGVAPPGDRVGLTLTLERALETMWLAFQPILDPRRDRIVAYEALLRSREPSLPNPMALLEAAERLAMVPSVGRRVRALAAEALASLPDDVLLFVNVHCDELSDDQLYNDANPLHGRAARIVMEVTERASLEAVNDVTGRARTLRGAGFRLAVDDLGAGYAGLSSFVALEPEFVKLDMSLVQGVRESITRQRVIRSMVDLCRELNIRVVAEGIETEADFECLKSMGCDLLQGYFIGRPEARVAERRSGG